MAGDGSPSLLVPWMSVPLPASPSRGARPGDRLLPGLTPRVAHRARVPLAEPLPAPSQHFPSPSDLDRFHTGAIWFAEFWKCLQLKC